MCCFHVPLQAAQTVAGAGELMKASIIPCAFYRYQRLRSNVPIGNALGQACAWTSGARTPA